MSNLPSGTTGADIDRTVEDSPEQRPCKGCGEDPGNCVCGWCDVCGNKTCICTSLSDEPYNQNQQRGRATGQHEQRNQQADIFQGEPMYKMWNPDEKVKLYGWRPTDPTRIDITCESALLLQVAVDSMFEHYDRIDLLAPGEWRKQLEDEREQAAADREEAAKEFWSDLEIEGSGL